ncbi:uncharacterized protein LOC133792092 [Humulus lupulus]|uniref:uncharacterized protein LOC133792092 n=1 Tax=Humulus lupulus TaxID=3486 RepID=UPI002B4127CD|nr:uncharacterized protein LOC133792092 [Humulus lupulus]
MARLRKSHAFVALFAVLISMEMAINARGQGGNNGNNIGNNNSGDNNGNGNGNNNSGDNNGNNNGNNNSGSNNGNGNGNNNNGGSNGNGNGNNNGGSNNGNGNGNNNSGSNNGNGNGNGNGNSNDKPTKPTKPAGDAASTHYDVLTPLASGRERAFCKARGKCNSKTLTCPAECPSRKPKNNKKKKGCYVDCSSKCEVTCKFRRPNCNGYGSLCYDPRFVGGDGIMFYFHGAKGGNFAIVSDENLQINAHSIGTRPQGRTRDYTWVQALSVMFDTHTLVIGAKRVSQWNDANDALIASWDGESIQIPTDGEAEWRTDSTLNRRQVVLERTDDYNSIRVTVAGLVQMDIKVKPIGKEENRVHNYQIPEGDSFTHLETQFRFFDLSDSVEGVLGKTYQPGYVSPVKIGVPMPMMGGEDKYQTTSLYSPLCNLCRFQWPSMSDNNGEVAQF